MNDTDLMLDIVAGRATVARQLRDVAELLEDPFIELQQQMELTAIVADHAAILLKMVKLETELQD